jgi:RimJ/RimL family protein N-acetyltransferase
MEWADHVPTVEESEENRCRTHERFAAGEDFGLQAYRREDGELVAVLGLHPKDWAVPKFEIGYWCRARYQGQGYVTEAVRAVAAAAFEVMGARRLEIRCDERNVRSRRVAERAGFHLEAKLRNDAVAPDGELRNTLILARLPPEAPG